VAHTVNRWVAFIQIKEYFEHMINGSIYHLLPGIVENTFGWNNPAEASDR